MTRSVDYDSVAASFDKRYERSDYAQVSKLLLEFVEGADGNILEVGCGTGHWLGELAGHTIHAIGIDPSRGMLEEAARSRTSASIVQGRAEMLPWADNSFDRLFCVNSFHHFQDKEGFVSEAARVLRPGGRIVIVGLDPHTGLDKWWLYDYFPQVLDIDRARYPSTGAIRKMFQSQGFADCRTNEVLHFPDKMGARQALETGRLAKTTTSQLTMLTDTEYGHGIAVLVKDIESAEARGAALSIGADLRLYATTGYSRTR
jgi:ubiquinone/menaquinone biosynthesis C-methylase UbiE